MDLAVPQLTDNLARAQSLEQLTRPLLEMLAGLTGMESTYLTTVDLILGLQHVQFARNAGEMQIPEGLDVPWQDTLCRRSMDEVIPYADDVPTRWGDSDAAAALGIQTYASVPIRTVEGKLLGTLCAASTSRIPSNPSSHPMLQLFSKLIGNFIEREQLVAELQIRNERLTALAMTDPLTELPNRRAILSELPRMSARAQRSGTFVLVALVDLDGFKAINDTRGHHVGDEFLREIGRRLTQAVRTVDVAGRVGGDEFVVLGPGAVPPAEGMLEWASHAVPIFQQRLHDATVGRYELPSAQFDYGGASVGVVAIDPAKVGPDEAMQRADAEMYRVKQARRAGAQAAR